jgi:hypothetical protein
VRLYGSILKGVRQLYVNSLALMVIVIGDLCKPYHGIMSMNALYCFRGRSQPARITDVLGAWYWVQPCTRTASLVPTFRAGNLQLGRRRGVFD